MLGVAGSPSNGPSAALPDQSRHGGAVSSLPDQAQVVIIGAGISGNMVASHLARLGWREMVLLDQGPFPNPGGSTGHSSSMIWLPEASRELDAVTAEANRQYRELGVFTRSGGLEVARTPERIEELKRRLGMARLWGHEARLMTPAEIGEMVPYVDTSVVLGGIYQPETGVVDPVEAGRIVREAAEQLGALRSWPFVEILGIDVERGRVAAVRTDRGEIRTERVVVCAGVWAARLGRMAGVAVPMTAGVVQAIHVGPLPVFESRAGEISYPIVRDIDSQMYMRQHGSSMEVGSYALRPILIDADDIPSIESSSLTPTELPITWDDFEPSMEHALELMPDIFGHANAEIPYAINGLVSVSSDGLPILGEAPEVRGFWSVNRVDVKVAPTVARLVAEWMTNGDRAAYPHPYHIARFHDHERTDLHVRERGAERFSRNYRIIHPFEEFSSCRDQRLSPMHVRQVALGAVLSEQAGWEVARWYGANEALAAELGERAMPRPHPWDSRGWSPIVNAEHLALRERVALEDTTAQAVFEVTGQAAAAWLDGLAVAALDVPGCVVPTWLLGPNGSVASEVTVVRLAEDRFWILGAVGRQMRDAKWLRDHLPDDGGVTVRDVTSGWCSIGVWGPRSPDLLRAVRAPADAHADMAAWTARATDIGTVRGVLIRTARLGDPGWEVFAPMEQGLRLWDTLWEAGRPLGVVATGSGMSSAGGRLEAGLASRAWELAGYDLVEAGLGAPAKAADFVGRQAYLEQLDRAPVALLCRLVVEDHRSPSTGERRFPLGGEPILTRSGDVLVDARGRRSFVTSAGSVPTLGRHVLFGYLPPQQAVVGSELAVECFGERYPVRVIALGAVHPSTLGAVARLVEG
jgi:glycine cleavage system aminomethyltransferase T/glycine/D-amino acid oxidase-like deaminating enzyme